MKMDETSKVDPQELYESDPHYPACFKGQSWAQLDRYERSVMEEVALRVEIKRRLESLLAEDFEREAEKTDARMQRIRDRSELLERDRKRLDDELEAAKEKHRMAHDALSEQVLEINREWAYADREQRVIHGIRENRKEGCGEGWGA